MNVDQRHIFYEKKTNSLKVFRVISGLASLDINGRLLGMAAALFVILEGVSSCTCNYDYHHNLN